MPAKKPNDRAEPVKPTSTPQSGRPELSLEKSIGVRIKEKREALGLNFEQFSALTREYDAEGIAAVTLRRYEREGDGASLPGLRELRILCDTLAASADFLLTGRSDPDYKKRDREDWEALKTIVARIARPSPLPGLDGPDPYANFERQEKLKRARLHTKAEDT